MSDVGAQPRYTFLALFAGCGVGLVSGAFYFASLARPDLNRVEIGFQYAFFGLLPLVIGCVAVGLPAVRLLNRYDVSARVAFCSAVLLGCAITIVIGVVTLFFGLQNVAGSVVLFGTPTIWCATAAGILIPWLSKLRITNIVIMAVVVGIAVIGAASLLVPGLIPAP